METRIQKWGNSLAVRLPRDVVRKLALRIGSRVSVAEKRRRIVIEPSASNNVPLKELIRRITKENRHKEATWGVGRGKEVW